MVGTRTVWYRWSMVLSYSITWQKIKKVLVRRKFRREIIPIYKLLTIISQMEKPKLPVWFCLSWTFQFLTRDWLTPNYTQSISHSPRICFLEPCGYVRNSEKVRPKISSVIFSWLFCHKQFKSHSIGLTFVWIAFEWFE